MINRDDLMTSDVNQPYDPDMCICRYELYTSERVMDQYIILGLIEKVLFYWVVQKSWNTFFSKKQIPPQSVTLPVNLNIVFKPDTNNFKSGNSFAWIL